MKLAWIALSVVFLCVAPAQAEIRVVSSVEWKAVISPLIVRAKVAAMKDATGLHAGISLRDVTLEVEEVLKGAIEGKALACRVPGQGAAAADPWVAWKTSGHPVLLFLRRVQDGEGLAVECENPAVRIKVNWLQSRHPRFTFYVMPVDWEGENRQVTGETVIAAGHVVPSPIPSSVASLSSYLGQTDHFRAFASTSGHDGGNDPFTQALAALGLRGAKRP